jgi:hypothetical protein
MRNSFYFWFVIKKLLKIFLFGVIMIAAFPSSAQTVVTSYHKDSTIILTRDNRLDKLITKQKDANALKQTIPGYRVQIYFGGIRPKASEVKIEFSKEHPDVPAYLTYSAPNFKVRVGDFRTRLEGVKFMKSIEGQYPTMFIVPDEVALPPLR